MHAEHPELIKDQFWEQGVPDELPYTLAAEETRTDEPWAASTKVEKSLLIKFTIYYKSTFNSILPSVNPKIGRPFIINLNLYLVLYLVDFNNTLISTKGGECVTQTI